jgi:hypothetical protein
MRIIARSERERIAWKYWVNFITLILLGTPFQLQELPNAPHNRLPTKRSVVGSPS